MTTHSHSSSIERTGRISAILAVVCAIHCALMPLVITLLPLVGMQFLASHEVEIVLLGLGLGFGIYGVGKGFLTHSNRLPLAVVLLGVALVLSGLFFVPESMEPFFVSGGALLVGAAQVLNIRATRTCNNC